MKRIAVIGGGAAGMMFSIHAAGAGHEVHLYEKNEKLGKKLFITGKGRCNVTNDSDEQQFLQSVISNPRFLYSAIYGWNSGDVIRFFEEAGVKLKTERGNRVFPQSDHSSDVIHALERQLEKNDVQIHLNCPVQGIRIHEEEVSGILLKNGKEIPADAVVVATGGMSYPLTGSTGDGYRFAESAGHKVIPPEPSLVSLLTEEEYVRKMQGLSLRNVKLTIKKGKKKIFEDFGEMLFTHNGISGPLVLTASARLGKDLKNGSLQAWIDLKPALEREKLDARLLRDFTEASNRQFRNILGGLLPSSMIPVIIELSGIDPDKRVHDITREERNRLLMLLKEFPLTIIGKGSFHEAIITKGGVNVKEIDPGTMESKIIKGLYFIGEVLDVDAVTGGFNLQIAWSTAHLAAASIE